MYVTHCVRKANGFGLHTSDISHIVYDWLTHCAEDTRIWILCLFSVIARREHCKQVLLRFGDYANIDPVYITGPVNHSNIVNRRHWKRLCQLEDRRHRKSSVTMKEGIEIILVPMQSGTTNLTLVIMETNVSDQVGQFQSKEGYGQTTTDETTLYIHTFSIVIFVTALGLCIRFVSDVFVRKCVLGFAQGSWMDQHDEAFSRKLGQLWVPWCMTTSSHGNALFITGALSEDPPVTGGFLPQSVINADLRCFLCC